MIKKAFKISEAIISAALITSVLLFSVWIITNAFQMFELLRLWY